MVDVENLSEESQLDALTKRVQDLEFQIGAVQTYPWKDKVSQKVSSVSDLVAGEDLTNGQTARVCGTDFIILGNDGTRVGSTSQGLGTRLALCQAFSLAHFDTATGSGITQVQLYVKTGSDNVYFKFSIVNDNSGQPGSTEYVSTTANSSSPTTFVLFTLDFTDWLPTANTTYWMIVERYSGDTIAPIVDRVATTSYSNGRTNVSNAWITDSDTNDWWIKIYFTEATANRVYLADARSTDAGKLFAGIVDRNAKSGETVRLISEGIKDDFSSLTQGSIYYLTDTAGTAGTTAGSHTIPIGKSFSDKILYIQMPSLS